jgi:hypothetical protein
MIDIVIRDCGYGEWLPLIIVTATRQELYRGDRLSSSDAAWLRGKTAWDESQTGNIIEFKRKNGL